jgi:gas vesicle protein GvpO
MADLTEAQRKRQEARRKRRGRSEEPEPEPNDSSDSQNGEPLEAVKQAAKVAAAGAAVGAAAAAARALTHHGNNGEAEQHAAEDESDEPAAEAEPDDESLAGQPEEHQLEEKQPETQAQNQEDEEQDEEEPELEPVGGASLGDASMAMRTARDQLQELLGKAVESASALERTHDGWVATLEVVELSRVPETTDVLASYELELDQSLGLRSYRQVRRYTRSQANGDDL